MMLTIGIIIFTSIVIYFAGEYFATASSLIGERLQVSKSVKGATFDAVSSSLPELMIALFSVISFGEFAVGVGTIAGSALFNLLLIPAVSIFAAGGTLRFSKIVVTRDAWFHLLSKIVLFVMVFFTASWNMLLALLLLFLYFLYIVILLKEKSTTKKDSSLPNWSLKKIILVAVSMVAVIAAGAYYLTESSIQLASALGVPPLLIAFTIVAAATSVPDMIISLVNARKGSGDDAMANVLGSNTFDILVGLGLPLLIATLLIGPLTVSISHPELVTLLLLVSIGCTVLMQKRTFTKVHAWLFILTYVLITGYVVWLALM
jgi:cation:H+ antiporter